MRRLATERSGDRQLHRANELDALTGILPLERREALAALLTDEDVATLKHLGRERNGPPYPAGIGLRFGLPGSMDPGCDRPPPPLACH